MRVPFFYIRPDQVYIRPDQDSNKPRQIASVASALFSV